MIMGLSAVPKGNGASVGASVAATGVLQSVRRVGTGVALAQALNAKGGQQQ